MKIITSSILFCSVLVLLGCNDSDSRNIRENADQAAIEKYEAHQAAIIASEKDQK